MARAGEGEAAASNSAGFQGGDGGEAGEEEQLEDDEDAFDDPRIAILDAALDHVEAHG